MAMTAVSCGTVVTGQCEFQSLLRRAADEGASDLLLVAGSRPCVFVRGHWVDLDEPTLAANAVDSLILTHLSERQRGVFDREMDVDVGLDVEGVGRIRVNLHRQQRTLAAAIRFIPQRIPDLEDLNLPPIVADLTDVPRGLVLVTGGTGSGKSTTLAAMIQRINRTRRAHVITLEDPIEYEFSNDRCIIEQREVGVDVPSFAGALRHVVRQKPDVIMVGEMRDRETISTTLTAAEIGHLVIATMHTVTAGQTIERIVDVFEASQQPYVRVQLANTLRAVLCQSLVPADSPQGLIPVTEVMMRTPAVARAIRDNELHLLGAMIETGQNEGMHPFDRSLAEWVQRGVVQTEHALARAVDAQSLRRQLQRSSSQASGRRAKRTAK